MRTRPCGPLGCHREGRLSAPESESSLVGGVVTQSDVMAEERGGAIESWLLALLAGGTVGGGELGRRWRTEAAVPGSLP